MFIVIGMLHGLRIFFRYSSIVYPQFFLYLPVHGHNSIKLYVQFTFLCHLNLSLYSYTDKRLEKKVGKGVLYRKIFFC